MCFVLPGRVDDVSDLKNQVVLLIKILDQVPDSWAAKYVKRVLRGLYPEPQCHYCERRLEWNGLSTEDPRHKDGVTLDHILPQSKGGKWVPWNLVICCDKCNKQRGNEDYAVFFKRKSARRRRTVS